MSPPEQSRRRFAPVPIETTFESVRGGNRQKQPASQSQQGQSLVGPNPELTPEPSPRSPSPVPQQLRPRRRFAPQLIETSRRSRRVGDVGPATRPTDKTDITPYTKNIYTATRHKYRRHEESHTDVEHSSPAPPTRRESEDEAVQEYLLELAAKEAERQIREALDIFPNSRAREGNVDHFYYRESSESDETPESTSPARADSEVRPRRKSSNLGMNWWHKHMQEHAEHLSEEQRDEMAVDDEPAEAEDMEGVQETEAGSNIGEVMRTDSDLDKMDLELPPDSMWITTSRKGSVHGDRRHIGESHMPLVAAEPLTTAPKAAEPPSFKLIGESPMPLLPTTPGLKPSDIPYAKPGQIPPDTSFRNSPSPFGRPFGGLGYKPATPTQQKRQAVSPPMLGKDLKFRKCPSPKQTKFEPDHPFAERHAEERYRDPTGRKGLWRGYCWRSESNDCFLVPADLHAPLMLVTPQPPATPGGSDTSRLSDEPSSLLWTSSHSSGSAESRAGPGAGEPKGLHRLHGIDEKLQREKVEAERVQAARNDKIEQEFDDAFVTQVYNYLSLGYPATARAYDEELSRISLVSMEDLERDDEKQLAKGHLVEAAPDAPREERDARWKALRTYVTQWARQHPDLDGGAPTAWGVRERRGSWAI